MPLNILVSLQPTRVIIEWSSDYHCRVFAAVDSTANKSRDESPTEKSIAAQTVKKFPLSWTKEDYSFVRKI
jgi:hypothetical protein